MHTFKYCQNWIRSNKANVLFFFFLFFLFFYLTKHSKCEKNVFSCYWIIELLDITFADRHMNQINICFLLSYKNHWKSTDKRPLTYLKCIVKISRSNHKILVILIKFVILSNVAYFLTLAIVFLACKHILYGS